MSIYFIQHRCSFSIGTFCAPHDLVVNEELGDVSDFVSLNAPKSKYDFNCLTLDGKGVASFDDSRVPILFLNLMMKHPARCHKN